MQDHEIPQGTILALHDGKATVRVDTGGCNGCGHGSSCSVGRIASGRVTRLELDAPPGLRVGERVSLAPPATGLPLMAALGYLLPAFALVLGAGLGLSLSGSDGGTALGALAGFLLALVLVRLLSALRPGLMPVPRIEPLSTRSISIVPLSYTEPHHER